MELIFSFFFFFSKESLPNNDWTLPWIKQSLSDRLWGVVKDIKDVKTLFLPLEQVGFGQGYVGNGKAPIILGNNIETKPNLMPYKWARKLEVTK